MFKGHACVHRKRTRVPAHANMHHVRGQENWRCAARGGFFFQRIFSPVSQCDLYVINTLAQTDKMNVHTVHAHHIILWSVRFCLVRFCGSLLARKSPSTLKLLGRSTIHHRLNYITPTCNVQVLFIFFLESSNSSISFVARLIQHGTPQTETQTHKIHTHLTIFVLSALRRSVHIWWLVLSRLFIDRRSARGARFAH